MSLVEDIVDYFDVSDNAASTYVVEEATYHSSCVIISFKA